MAVLAVFGDLERFAADLYDYRYPITALGATLLLVAFYASFRLGVHRFVLAHRVAASVIGIPVVVAGVFAAIYFLSPLWERSFLEEPSPAVAAEVPAAGAAAKVVRRGEFTGADSFHFGRGQAQIIETEAGRYVLRFQDFSVRNGPDLYVYLSPDPEGFTSKAISLGKLKATDGAFNYDVPAGADLSQIRSAVVWCRQFAVMFASAPLLAP